MSSTFGTLEVARSGLNAAQVGMSVTSQNTANSSTTGYTRQAVDLKSVSPDTGAYRYAGSTTNIGQGVDSSSIYQIRDTFLDVRYRYENSNYNLANSTSSQMTPIEDQFNEISAGTASNNKLTGLTGMITNLYNALSTAASSSTSTTVSSTIESNADYLASSIRSDAAYLTSTMKSEESELGIYVSGGAGDTSNGNTTGGINGMIDNLQTLNKEISSYELTGNTANDLRDARNEVLDNLSSYIDIDTTEQPNGMITVKLKNDDDGKYIIDSKNTANEFTVGTNTVTTSDTSTSAKATANYTVLEWGDSISSKGVRTTAATPIATSTISGTKTTGQTIPANRIANVQGGIVKAYLNVINGDGSAVDNPSTGECGNVGIPYIQKKLNELAVGFINIMNNANGNVIATDQTGGTDGVTSSTDSTAKKYPTQFITYMQKDSDGNDTSLYSIYTKDSSGDITAASSAPVSITDASGTTIDVASTVQVTSAWNKDPDLFINNYTGSSKALYYQAYRDVLDPDSKTKETVTELSTDGLTSAYGGSFSNFATTFSSDLSTAVNKATTGASSAKITRKNLDTQRQSVSSVSTNDEATNLIKYQQAYNANARVITTIDEMLDKLINSTGTVGL